MGVIVVVRGNNGAVTARALMETGAWKGRRKLEPVEACPLAVDKDGIVGARKLDRVFNGFFRLTDIADHEQPFDKKARLLREVDGADCPSAGDALVDRLQDLIVPRLDAERDDGEASLSHGAECGLVGSVDVREAGEVELHLALSNLVTEGDNPLLAESKGVVHDPKIGEPVDLL